MLKKPVKTTELYVPKGNMQDECFYLDLLGFNSIEIATMVTDSFKLTKRPLKSHEVETMIEAESILYHYASMREPETKLIVRRK